MYFSFFISPLDFYSTVYKIMEAGRHSGTKYSKNLIFLADGHWNEIDVP